MSARILAIRPRALGDVVLVTPALRALHRGFPDAELEVVTEPRYAPLLAGLPGVTQVWPIERSPAGTFDTARLMRDRGYALAVDFFGNPRTALLTRQSGAPRRAGYALRGRAGAYTVRVPRTLPRPDGGREYAAATHVRLAVAAGGIEDGLHTRITLAADAPARAAALLDAAGVREPARTIGIVAAGTWPTKTWPVSHAATLCRALLAAGHPLLLIHGPGEAAVVSRLRTLVPRLLALPHCDVPDLAAVIAQLRAVIGTDSGPRHLAAALGVTSFAWFGPTHPDTWNPPGAQHGYWWSDLPCRGCDRTRCPHWNCMPGLAPADAGARVLAHLEAHGRAPAHGPAAGA
jgi:ADP-heptose:LPS heptosyltransferase